MLCQVKVSPLRFVLFFNGLEARNGVKNRREFTEESTRAWRLTTKNENELKQVEP